MLRPCNGDESIAQAFPLLDIHMQIDYTHVHLKLHFRQRSTFHFFHASLVQMPLFNTLATHVLAHQIHVLTIVKDSLSELQQQFPITKL